MDDLNEAELYELLHRGHDGDIEFYQRCCETAALVLELGSGSGRAAIPLARAGTTVVGLELDEAMIALAQRATEHEAPEVRARLSWVRGDMTTYKLDQRFDRVLLPYNTLLCLLSPEETERCLALAHQHLKPQGQLVFDVYHADEMHRDADEDDDSDDDEPLVTISHAEQVFDVYEQSDWLRDEQRLDTSYRFAPRDGEGDYTQRIPQRYLLSTEIQTLLEQHGFRLLRHDGGFNGETLSDDSLHHVVVAVRD